MVDVSEKNCQNRKNKKHNTTATLVFQLTKNEYITNHIMSYVVDKTYYDYIETTAHFEYLNELQLFEMASHATQPNMGVHIPTFINNRETMFKNQTFFINHPITTPITISYHIRNTLRYNKEHCFCFSYFYP